MQVRVLNLNTHPYKENFRDRVIEIPAGGHVEMDEDEAEYFLTAYTAPRKDAQGRPDPLYFKKLKIHPDDLKALRDKAANPSLVCHANGQKVLSQAELTAVLGNFTHMLAGRDENAEVDMKKQNSTLKRENKELKSRLELIEEKLGLKGEANAESV